VHDGIPDAFTFIAEKSSNGQLIVTIHSKDLSTELAKITGLESLRPKNDFSHISVDGFLLLRSYESLRIHLRSLQSSYTLESPTSLISELELLVDHFLADGEVFESYGFENLYENGFLTYEHWKVFQQTKLQREISTLDEGFCTVDTLAGDVEAEELLTSPSCATSDSTLNLQVSGTELEVTSILEDDEVPPESHSVSRTLVKRNFLTGEVPEVFNSANGFKEIKFYRSKSSPFRQGMLLDEAVVRGDVTVVERLLDEGADVNGYVGTSYRTTPILEAVHFEHEKDQYTVIIDSTATSKYVALRNTLFIGKRHNIPVVEAAKAGHGRVVRLLLQKGAAASDLEALMTPKKIESMQRERQYRRLRRQFLQQHLLMEEASQLSSTEFQQLRNSFQNHREAWAAGIRTMRRLCNGKSPRGLHNIAAFLCISKAISETLDGAEDGYYSTQFLHDVERWQVLFTSEELSAYQALVHAMWGVCLSESPSQSGEALDLLTLTDFQSLLSALISQEENLSFHHTHKHGLEISQRRFLSRNYPHSAHLNTTASVSALGPLGGRDSQSLETPPPEPPDIHPSARTNCLEENIKSDLSAACLNVTVVLLMAGAIFAIIIIFLQGLSLIRILIQPYRIYSLTYVSTY
jgi:hypothetical protein